MRLRATVADAQTFLNVIHAIERLSKTCVIMFSETQLRIICDSPVDGGIQVWSEIKVETLFTDYRILSNSNNEISMQIGTTPLLSVLKAALSSQEVVLKLAKKNDHAVLNFDLSIQTRQNKRKLVTKDVNIEVLKPTDAARLKEPMCPIPDIHIFLPPLSKLRVVTDHLRQLSDEMGISANSTGELKFFIETDTVKAITEWKDCELLETERDKQNEVSDPKAYFGTLVSVKNFLKFLSSHVISTRTLMCICHKSCLIMYVYIRGFGEPGGVLTYYIPGLLDGVDD